MLPILVDAVMLDKILASTSVKPRYPVAAKPHITHAPQRHAPRIIGLGLTIPENWSKDHARISEQIERSLMAKPEFRHLSILPPGSLHFVVKFA